MKLILCLVLGSLTTISFAQKTITEGTVVYTVEWLPTPQMQQIAAMFPTELTVYFKGDSSATISKSAFTTTNSILNTKTEFQRLLIDVPMNGKKYSVLFSPDDIEMMKENGPDFSISAGTDTKKIHEYNAQKYNVTEKKSGKTTEAWFTKDIVVNQNSLTQFFDRSLGFPLQFNSFQSGMGIKAVVKEVKEGKVPSAIFSASKDYEEITFAQLMSMMGGGRR